MKISLKNLKDLIRNNISNNTYIDSDIEYCGDDKWELRITLENLNTEETNKIYSKVYDYYISTWDNFEINANELEEIVEKAHQIDEEWFS